MREKRGNERRRKGLKQYIADRRLAAVSLVLGVLMGLMILLGIRYSRNELIYRTPGEFLGQLIGWTVCMTVMVWAICVGLDALGRGWPEVRNFQFRKFLPVNSYAATIFLYKTFSGKMPVHVIWRRAASTLTAARYPAPPSPAGCAAAPDPLPAL